MPYIRRIDKLKISNEAEVDSCTTRSPDNGETLIYVDNLDTAGELQYAIAVLIKSFMKRKGLKYQRCNDVMGALAGAQMEFYRRTVAPYEDKKIEENGDV